MNADKRREIFARLKGANPKPRSELEYRTPFELLVAVVLSAQATDKSVNLATVELFKAANTPAALLGLGRRGLERHIRRIGLYRTKAKNVIALSRELVARHGGRVPRERDALEALPGVGRKTANVVLASLPGGEPALAVDTHVGRLARRLGLSREEDPRKVERDLCAQLPRDSWGFASHALILHGRGVCGALRPACERCDLAPLCPSAFRAAPGKLGVERRRT